VIQVSEYKRKDNLIPSDVAIKNAKPKEKPYRIKDARGFYLRVNPGGSKWWRMEYAIDGKRNMLSIGVYPSVSLAKARENYRALQAMIAGGIDPSETRKQARIEKAEALDREQRKAKGIPIKGSFEEITRTWMTSTAHTVRDMTRQKKIRRFERHVFPAIGDKDMKEIKSPEIYGLLKPLIARNELETAHRAHSEISAVFAYAIAHGFADYDPAQPVGTQLPPQSKASGGPDRAERCSRAAPGHLQLPRNLRCSMRLPVFALGFSTSRRDPANGMEGCRPGRQRMALFRHQDRSPAHCPIIEAGHRDTSSHQAVDRIRPLCLSIQPRRRPSDVGQHHPNRA